MSDLHDKIERALADVKAGKIILVADAGTRENEIDAFICANAATIENLTFMIKECSGLMCLTVTDEKIRQLNIPPMATNKNDKLGTPFYTPVDARHGTTTGMSVVDRLKTIETILRSDTTNADIIHPGHLQILRCQPGMLTTRLGHTNAATQLCAMADQPLVGIIVEIINPDGTMLNNAQGIEFAKKHNLTLISIDEIVQYCYETAWHPPKI